MLYIEIAGKRTYFDSLIEAVAAASDYHQRTGIIVGIFRS